MEKFKTQILPGLLAVLLWIVSAILGLACVKLGSEIFIWIFAQFSLGVATISALNWIVVIVLSLIYLGVLIATGEYHAKHYGKPGSWKLFLETLGVELLIILVAYFMGLSA